MPTVPVVDQTAVGAQPFSSGSVAPVRSYSPEQLTNLGSTLQQVGGETMNQGETIGNRIAAQVDDAKTKSAETQFLNVAQNILHDPTQGYFRMQGKAAVAQYGPAKENLVNAGQNIRDQLNNDLQKKMFDQVLQHHLQTFGGQMADYNHSQSVAWSATESKARAGNYQLLAAQSSDSRYQKDADGNAVGEFAKYTKQMEGEVLNAAALAGFDPDSAQAKAMVREQYTSLNAAMISQMLDNHDAYGAKKWFDEQSAAGNIDLRNLTTLGNAVKGEYDRQRDSDIAGELKSAALTEGKSAPLTLTMPVSGSSINVTAGLGEARSGGRSHDGIDIAVPVGTQVTAPSAGRVTKVWTDDKFGGGLSVEIQMPNGYTAGFAHLSAANVRVGDELQQGTTLGLSGKTGNATGPVLHYMMKDADGKYVDPRQVSQPQPNAQGFAAPDALQSALQMLQRRDDIAPDQKRRIASMLEADHSHQRAAETQQYEDLKQQATDAFFKSGGNYNAIPAAIRTQLRPEDAYKFQKGIPTEDSVAAQEAFILHPENQTVAWVQAHQMDFSKGTFISYLTKAQNDANSPDKEKNALLDTTQMDDLLYKNGMGTLVNPKTGTPAAQSAVALKSRIMDQYVSEQNTTGKPLTRDRKGEIIRQTISDQVNIHGLLWDNKGVPVVGLNDSQAKNAYVTVGSQRVKLSAIPVQDNIQITQALLNAGMPVTQQAIAELWVKKNNGKVPTY